MALDRPQSLFYLVPQERNLTAKQDWIGRPAPRGTFWAPKVSFRGVLMKKEGKVSVRKFSDTVQCDGILWWGRATPLPAS